MSKGEQTLQKILIWHCPLLKLGGGRDVCFASDFKKCLEILRQYLTSHLLWKFFFIKNVVIAWYVSKVELYTNASTVF